MIEVSINYFIKVERFDKGRCVQETGLRRMSFTELLTDIEDPCLLGKESRGLAILQLNRRDPNGNQWELSVKSGAASCDDITIFLAWTPFPIILT